MVRITKDLLRKKAEHHDGILDDLEEISLHQLEIEKLENLSTFCRKLKILYLQNNIIPRIEDLEHLRDLRYLNMALNNITKIEGLSHCEFLEKLDLTANFIDLDEFEASMQHLAMLPHLREVYFMGNPFESWPHHKSYLIAMLPNLQTYNGSEISRTDRIRAQQDFRLLRDELRELANAKREEKGLPRVEAPADDDTSPWTPESRVATYRELAEQKRAEEERKKEMMPRERDYEQEHKEAVAKARAAEAENGRVRQCNEPGIEFRLDDEDGRGNVVLRLSLPRFLDTSLVEVDVHPGHVTAIIKGKVFRLAFPEPVASDSAKCQRSTTTGELVITVPKAVQNPTLSARLAMRAAEARAEEAAAKASAAAKPARQLSVAEQMMQAAAPQASAAVSIRGIVKKEAPLIEATSTTARGAKGAKGAKAATPTPAASTSAGDDDDVPPLE